ncbi:MAG: hypothetical protein A2504_08955 [Bdellovibrionales bacterium RIFOXYD12_FULL_39_22]|nr:MAG: hypothetical protein A2385_13470 [Bdellovibrionales bacterium RIFOXYB1_FULL_39_21]OFZ40901.1 MAG: hypothetical protein A2485_16275 [Bdellovibrionales bacterium RIFOXYC12_FULL_39_17]OFZ44755.1 MAG: hypothetical protein A2404_10845 [Bdellovibrionales bacterium RIFOXYC1_FULL_39_130]OFZ68319.1 MAG: hypothetical protein A2451_05365 [Bdellovibrionales bacterium RIFOXYC2_FULL_39_8]OFZ74206.1 MAG: hypothetical protein A2560_03510 [Bdellovibrionales bacterium RIFOXYD1_FULL_39_84]OFZ92086.1 MAG:
MSDVAVGKEVLSQCSKCKLALAHLIVSMKSDSAIGKVKCKTCQSIHAYKDPSKSKSRQLRTSKISSKRPEQSISDIWLEAVNKSQTKSRPYAMNTHFMVGDILDHPQFGPGVVERLIDSNKIEVIFRHQIKTLMHNKK